MSTASGRANHKPLAHAGTGEPIGEVVPITGHGSGPMEQYQSMDGAASCIEHYLQVCIHTPETNCAAQAAY